MRERSSASPSERLDIASFRHLRLRRSWPASAWRSPPPPGAGGEGPAPTTLGGPAAARTSSHIPTLRPRDALAGDRNPPSGDRTLQLPSKPPPKSPENPATNPL